jgi:hypothetical protein
LPDEPPSVAEAEAEADAESDAESEFVPFAVAVVEPPVVVLVEPDVAVALPVADVVLPLVVAAVVADVPVQRNVSDGQCCLIPSTLLTGAIISLEQHPLYAFNSFIPSKVEWRPCR